MYFTSTASPEQDSEEWYEMDDDWNVLLIAKCIHHFMKYARFSLRKSWNDESGVKLS
jgi:hypothetical protein